MNWTILPIALPLLTAATCLLWIRPSGIRRVVIVASAVTQLLIGVYLVERTCHDTIFVLPIGNWPAQLGIILVIDPLAAIMVALSSLTALAALLFGFIEVNPRLAHPLRVPLLQFLVMGINLAFCTGDLFNLFVAFELMLVASYALLTTEADDWDVKHAFPYLAVNLVGSTLFLCAAGLAYALFGTLNFAGIAERAAAMSGDPRVLALGLLLLVVFGLKAGLIPLHFWLPNSYPTLPIPLAALYSGMLTKVGVYVLLRVFGTVLPHQLELAHSLLTVLGAVTMVLAVLGAVSKNFIRGILSYQILGGIGFMVVAIGFFTPYSFAAAIFYVIHHIVVMSSLFLICGVGLCLNNTDDLDKMGNLWLRTPWLGVLFLFQALSLTGLPPLSGFWGKYMIIVACLQKGAYVLVAAAIAASILTLLNMLKIWNSAFWTVSPTTEVRVHDRRWVSMSWVVAGLALVSVGIGLGAEGVLALATRAAEQTLDQAAYIDAVFSHPGKAPPH